VDYFVARTIADAYAQDCKYVDGLKRPIDTLVGLRDDYVIAAIMFADPTFRAMLVEEMWKTFDTSTADTFSRAASFDYAELV
jgi:hypothetical protein